MPRRIPVHPALLFLAPDQSLSRRPFSGFLALTDLGFAVVGPNGVFVLFAGVFDDLFRIGSTQAERMKIKAFKHA